MTLPKENQKLFVVEHHHKALAVWAKYRCVLDEPPTLLTLDHHTDTSKPFRNHIRSFFGNDFDVAENLRAEWLKKIDFKNEASVESAIEKLGNDEHIVTGIKSGIIFCALVLAHNARDTDLAVYEEHKIICRSLERGPPSIHVSRETCNQVLESSFLESSLQGFDQILQEAREAPLQARPYILDIDLDYLNTYDSIAPKNSSLIRKLARNAGLITIATEPEHVKNCALDFGLSSQNLLPALLDLLSVA